MNRAINSTSGFWLGDVNDRYYDPLTGRYNKPTGKDIFALAGYRQAVANFVRIVTGENIPVKYANHDESYTDGKTVVLSGGINDGNFDTLVGLALHEGSHVKLTDFRHLQNGLDNYIPKTLTDLGVQKDVQTVRIVKDMLNVVEDRRIDHFIFTTAPGYKGYYEAMYNKYFNAKSIDKALKEYRFREQNINDYMFHIVNFINENRTLDVLPGLRDVWNVLDLKNIGRLKTTDDALAVAIEMAEIVLNNLPDPKPQEEEEQQDDQQQPQGGGQGNEGEDDQQDQEQQEQQEGNEEGEGTPSPTDYNGNEENQEQQGQGGGQGDDTDDEETDGNGDGTTDFDDVIGDEEQDGSMGGGMTNDGEALPELNDLSANQQKELENAINRQKDFMDGESQKTKLSKKDHKAVDAAEKSGAKDVEVEGEIDYRSWTGGANRAKTSVRVYEKMTDELIDSGLCNMVNKYRSYRQDDKQEAIENGFRLGMVLGKKLNARNDEEKVTYNRLRKGKISKRLISSIGTGNTKIFEQEFISMSKPSSIHLSIDASGSMNGQKFYSALTMATAIAKACEIAGGIQVRIDFRSTSYGQGGKEIPEVLIAYDSRVDKSSKIRRTWKYLQTPGTTPEGLCFAAIQRMMDKGNGQYDSYFINISDGEPYFSNSDVNYGGAVATKHTRGEIKKMQQKGIEVLGYYLDGGNSDGEPSESFKKMYGNDSKKVNPNSVMQIAKTMNELLSRKS